MLRIPGRCDVRGAESREGVDGSQGETASHVTPKRADVAEPSPDVAAPSATSTLFSQLRLGAVLADALQDATYDGVSRILKQGDTV